MKYLTFRSRILPTLVPFSVLVILLLSASRGDAQIRGWGYNGTGQIGIGNTTSPQPNPATVAGVSDAVQIRVGDSHTIYLRSNGTLFASGENTDGELGNGTSGGATSVTSPTAVSGLTNVIQVGAGGFHSAALKSDGTVWSWGYNLYGETGNGTTVSTGCNCTPTPTQSTITNAIQISLGFNHTIALRADGTVWAWGLNDEGEIGDGTTVSRSTPVQVGVGVSGFTNIIAISAGANHGMALKGDGTVWVWGNNAEGEVGNGSTSVAQLLPVQNTTLTNVTQIYAGGGHNMARRTDGSVWVWGYNAYGQGSNGSGADQLTPVQKTSVSSVVDILGNGSFHNTVRTRGGSVLSWGYNVDGEIADGTTDPFNITPCECEPTPTLGSLGTGNAFAVAGRFTNFAGIVNAPTPVGSSVFIPGEQVRFTFASVTGAGTTSYSAIDPTTTGLSIPPGYTIKDNAPAYSITTTATRSGTVDVCLNVADTDTISNFNLLKVLHEEGGVFVDKTFSNSYRRREICAQVTSFSRFIVAQGVSAPTAANVSISGRVLTAEGRGLRNAVVELTDATGTTRRVITGALGYYRFSGIPAGSTYIAAVRAQKYSFEPQTIVLNDDLADLDFVAAGIRTNPPKTTPPITSRPIIRDR